MCLYECVSLSLCLCARVGALNMYSSLCVKVYIYVCSVLMYVSMCLSVWMSVRVHAWLVCEIACM